MTGQVENFDAVGVSDRERFFEKENLYVGGFSRNLRNGCKRGRFFAQRELADVIGTCQLVEVGRVVCEADRGIVAVRGPIPVLRNTQKYGVVAFGKGFGQFRFEPDLVHAVESRLCLDIIVIFDVSILVKRRF